MPHDLPPRQRVRLHPEPSAIAADRIDGAGQHAEFLFGEDTPENRKRVYRLQKQGAPIGKVGWILTSSKKKLGTWWDLVTSGTKA